MEIQIGKKYKYIVKGHTGKERKLNGIDHDKELGRYEATILDPPKKDNGHVLSGNRFWAQLTQKRICKETGNIIERRMEMWIKRELLVEEL